MKFIFCEHPKVMHDYCFQFYFFFELFSIFLATIKENQKAKIKFNWSRK